MPDPITAAAVLGGFKIALDVTNTALDCAKKLKDLLKESAPPEVTEAIAELQSALADAKLATAEAKVQTTGALEELESLRRERLELLKQIQATNLGQTMRGEYAERDGVLWLKNGDGPFCKSCSYRDNRPVPTNLLPPMFHATGKYQCPTCQGVAGGGGEFPPAGFMV